MHHNSFSLIYNDINSETYVVYRMNYPRGLMTFEVDIAGIKSISILSRKVLSRKKMDFIVEMFRNHIHCDKSSQRFSFSSMVFSMIA
jgi:hypothetical protein